jgi:ureidoglycolate dehydrogenase (NAD+)
VADDGLLVQAQPLTDFTQAVFEAVGMVAGDAADVAELLVWANLRGVDSHGVLRIPWYVELADARLMNPRPDVRVTRETVAVCQWDADRSLGPPVTKMAMRAVTEKARAVGIGWGLIRNVTHQGAMAYYSMMAAEEGMAGIAIVCSPPNMAPHGARAAGFHNSPITIAVPTAERPPLVLDMATSVAAGGKLQYAADRGAPLGEGWALDADGRPTTDATKAKILVPAGLYKGSGLAMMFECLASIMAANPLAEPFMAAGGAARPHNQNSIVAAVDISAFGDPGEYAERVDALIDGIKALPTADGCDEVLVPGELEHRAHARRAVDGIPLPAGTVAKLTAMADRFGLPRLTGHE